MGTRRRVTIIGLAVCILVAGTRLGMLIKTFGADHVLWGTDSIWWGSPQWQIEAFRRFTMPEDLITRLGYAPLGIDPSVRRNPVPADFIGKLKAAYLEEGARPSLTQYGWVSRAGC